MHSNDFHDHLKYAHHNARAMQPKNVYTCFSHSGFESNLDQFSSIHKVNHFSVRIDFN